MGRRSNDGDDGDKYYYDVSRTYRNGRPYQIREDIIMERPPTRYRRRPPSDVARDIFEQKITSNLEVKDRGSSRRSDTSNYGSRNGGPPPSRVSKSIKPDEDDARSEARSHRSNGQKGDRDATVVRDIHIHEGDPVRGDYIEVEDRVIDRHSSGHSHSSHGKSRHDINVTVDGERTRESSNHGSHGHSTRQHHEDIEVITTTSKRSHHSPPRVEDAQDEEVLVETRHLSPPPPPASIRSGRQRTRTPSPLVQNDDEIIDRREIVIEDRVMSPLPGKDRDEREFVFEATTEKSPYSRDYYEYGPPIARTREEFIFRRRQPVEEIQQRQVSGEEVVIQTQRSNSPRASISHQQKTAPTNIHETIKVTAPRSRKSSSGSSSSSSASSESEKVLLEVDRDIKVDNPAPAAQSAMSVKSSSRSTSGRAQSPAPDLTPIYKRPIIQEIIHHHRHYDHGMKPAPSLVEASVVTPAPPSVKPSHGDEQIDIHRHIHTGGKSIDEDIHIERESSPAPVEVPKLVLKPPSDEAIVERTVSERKTSSSRSKKSHSKSRSRAPSEARSEAVWTEVSKDLVMKDAIEDKGYRWSKRDKEHFVIKEELDYEKIKELVALTEAMRQKRRELIRDLTWDYDEGFRGLKIARGIPKHTEEKFYERDTTYYVDPKKVRKTSGHHHHHHHRHHEHHDHHHKDHHGE